ncbi:hypothetical protein OnM2_056001 [Erysiphe neolycopersici]|uniref:Uncharacterized protein n=1 Tax=Erysiphe neolycopersici TaxID=212602 RepID=A0A420HR09_9PEZI|nr:hypothetical protein OnM2_056001 [Erysiphe neolycopersici]
MAVDAKPIMLVARDFDLRSAHDILQAAISPNGTNDDTLNLISSLVLAESKLVRTSTIILASFNTLAAFVTASSILYDCYWASKRCSPKFKSSKFCVSSIHPAETFPLILAIAIFIQGLIFAGVQGRGLKALFIDGCAEISQIVWPAIFLVPFVQLVFGIECTLRSFRSLPFQARGKYDVTFCLGAVVLMLFATWIPSHINPELDTCFASLLWFVSGYGDLGIVLFSSTAGLMLICALIIYCRLSAVNLIDQHQHIVASRIIHHMIIGAVPLAFVLPFFITLSNNRGSTKLSMMATIMLNISGLLNGLLHLVLRSNTLNTSFGPKTENCWDIRKHDNRLFGFNELALYNPLFDPVPGPAAMSPHSTRYSNRSYQRGSMIASKIDVEKSLSISYAETDTLIGKTLVRQNTSPVSYSLFPHRDLYQSENQRTASIYDPRDLDLPLPTFFRNSRHTRNSSDSSVATVQIGLRLSQAPMDNLLDSYNYRLPATTYNSRIGGASSPTSPLSPQQLKPNTYSGFQKAVLPPVPLILHSSTSNFSPSVSTPLKSSVFNPNIWGDASNGPLKSERSDSFSQKKHHSTLKVPSFVEKVRAMSIRLSPDVYKPEKKLSISGKNTAEPKKTILSRSDTNPALKIPLSKEDWI